MSEDSPQTRSRTIGRVAVIQALFQHYSSSEPLDSIQKQFLLFRLHRLGREKLEFWEGQLPKANVTLFNQLMEALPDIIENAQTLIQHSLPSDWPMERIDPVLKALLIVATSELIKFPETPSRVIINEYIDIAHGFFSGDEPKMVNGILNNLARTTREGEFK